MQLLPKPERRRVLKKSQSLRWIVAGFVFTVMEQVAGAVGYELIPGPKWQTSLILGVIFAGAFVARLLAAKDD
jgi:hypothetical protein